jgi:hypothetical protein
MDKIQVRTPTGSSDGADVQGYEKVPQPQRRRRSKQAPS